MTEDSTNPSDHKERRNWFARLLYEWDEYRFDQLVEFISAAVLALATVGTAWCGYQASIWGGEQQAQYVEASAANVESARLSNRALQIQSLHVGLFVEWLSATSDGKQSLADYFYQHFPPELKLATDAWLALDPLANPDLPGPFALPEYQLEDLQESERFGQIADKLFEQATLANEISDNYVLLTVIFASVLFFGGISGKFKSRLIDLGMLIVAFITFVIGLGVLLTYPIH